MKKFSVIKSTILVFILVIYLFHGEILSNYAKFFHSSDYTKGADAVLILSGNPATRVERAVELYQDGYAKKIMFTSAIHMGNKYHHIFKTQSDMVKEALDFDKIVDYEMVPSTKGGATSTFDEAYDLAQYVIKNNLKHIIIVTDDFHTARSIYAFNKIFDMLELNTKLEIAGAKNNSFNETNWWHSEVGLSMYILEPIKFMFYFFRTRNLEIIKES